MALYEVIFRFEWCLGAAQPCRFTHHPDAKAHKAAANGAMNLFAKFLRHCRTAELFSPGNTVLLAVSGGVDSVVMLDLFVRGAPSLQLELAVAHIDHQLRAESPADADFVRSLAAAHHLPFFVRQISPQTHARAHRLSLETAARLLRYEALQSICAQAGAEVLATAHNANDQAETVLYRVLRGTGLAGLAGIAEKRGNLVRPLLPFSRAQIVAYARACDLSWREDGSNADLAMARNRLRHEVIPVLSRQFNPGLVRALCRTARIAREAHAVLLRQGEQALADAVKEQSVERIVLDIEQISKYNRFIHPYVVRRVFALLQTGEHPPGSREIWRVLDLMRRRVVGARVEFKDRRLRVLRDRDGVVFERTEASEFAADVQLNVPCPIPATSWSLLVESEPWQADSRLPEPAAHTAYIDAEQARGRLQVHWPRRGDRFVPLGMSATKKLSDFLADQKLTLRQRAHTPVLECESGIVWVCGLRIDERFKVTDSTRRVLHLRLLPPA